MFISSLLSDSRLTTGKSEFVINTLVSEILSCLCYFLQFTLLGTKVLIECVFFFIIFCRKFLFTVMLFLYVRFNFCGFYLQKRYMLFTISYSMIKHVPYVRQLLVECYNCTALFGYFQCLLTHRVTAITCLAEPTVYLVILPLKICNKSSVGLQINRQILISHGLYNRILYKVRIKFGIQKDILNASWDILIMRALHQCITRIFMVMSVAKDYILKHHTGLYSCRNSYVFVYTFANLHPVTQYLLVIVY